MATLTIRNLPDAIRDRLRVRAAQKGRSTEAEVRSLLTEVVAEEAGPDLTVRERLATSDTAKSSEGFAEGSAEWVVETRRGNLALDADGSLRLPASFLRAAGVEPGDTVLARVVNGEVRLSGYAASLKRAQWIAQHFHRPGASEVDDFIAERRAAGARGD